MAASLISQPSDTILVEVSDKEGGSANILDTVRAPSCCLFVVCCCK